MSFGEDRETRIEAYRIGGWYGDQEKPFVVRIVRPELEATYSMSKAEAENLLQDLADVLEHANP